MSQIHICMYTYIHNPCICKHIYRFTYIHTNVYIYVHAQAMSGGTAREGGGGHGELAGDMVNYTNLHIYLFINIMHIYAYTGCQRRNGKGGRRGTW